MAKVTSANGYPEPSFIVFEFDTKHFQNVKLQADGKLVLSMTVSNRPMFNEEFTANLRGELGDITAERMIEDASYALNREIAVRLLLRE